MSHARHPLHWELLGRIPYGDAVELQLAVREGVKRGTGPEHLLLLGGAPRAIRRTSIVRKPHLPAPGSGQILPAEESMKRPR